ncbi:MAG: hypothetical protein EHM88_16475, partial [Candidatus Rokuibacteriota bacterium]
MRCDPRRRPWRHRGAARSPFSSAPRSSSWSPGQRWRSSRAPPGPVWRDPRDRSRPEAVVKRYRDIVGDGGSNIVGQVEAQQARLGARLREVRAIIAVVSGKGGVGKSSITANLAGAFALAGARVGVLDADLNGPSMATMLGVRGRTLTVGPAGVEPPAGALGIGVMSMDLLLAGDATPLTWDAPSQAEAHTWRGTMEANALREFLADTAWGPLDVLLLDLPPGTDRLATVTGLVPALSGT